MAYYLFLLSSARPDGNSETLARTAAAALPDHHTQTWLRLDDHPLPPFRDVRHAGERTYAMPTGHALTLLDATLAAEHLVLAAPVYWYSLPAPAKLYLDHWSHWMRVPGLDFRARMRGRSLYLTSAMAGDDPAEAEPLVRALQLTADYMGMRWGGAVVAHANAAGDVLDDAAALATARRLLTNV